MNKLTSPALAALLALAFMAPGAQAQRAAAVPKAAFAAADAAYKAYERREYGTAVDRAREAVRLAPAQRDYWVLLVNALAAAGRYAEADQAAERGVRAVGAQPALTQARQSIRRAQAQASGSEMYKALQAGDMPAAIAHARAAVNYAPEHPAYRLALVHALLRGGQYVEAEKIAGETIALLPDSAAPLALRAYARQQLGRAAEARADYDRALQQKGLTPSAARELRLIAADAALSAGEPGRAIELLQVLPANDPAVAPRMDVARQLAGAPAGAQRIALVPPTLDCSQVEQAQTCALVAAAAPAPAAPGYVAASAGYRALQAGDATTALEQARAATAAAPNNRDYQLLHMNAARAAGQMEEAEAAATAAGSPLDVAYIATQRHEDRKAADAFAQADAAHQLPATALQDAGYAAVRARRDAEAVRYFERAIDADDTLQLKMEPQMRFATRRTIAEVERRFGVLASLTYARGPGAAVPGFGVVNSGSQKSLQAGVEAYWRPWGFMNGRFVELFARGFETLSSEGGGATGGDSFQGALGIRWKPITSQNIVLSFSRLFGSNTASDWLAQAAYSLDRGTDLRVDVPSWWTTRIAFEVGRYLQPGQTYGLANLMLGRSYRLGDGNWVAFPHGVIAAEYNSALPDSTSVGAGAGVSLRRWFREDKYHAPRSYVDLTLQYRAHVGGDDRIRGPYVNALVSY